MDLVATEFFLSSVKRALGGVLEVVTAHSKKAVLSRERHVRNPITIDVDFWYITKQGGHCSSFNNKKINDKVVKFI